MDFAVISCFKIINFYRFSNLLTQKSQRTSWEKKCQLKLETKNLKERVASMRQEKK
jgi:hypothetical protein